MGNSKLKCPDKTQADLFHVQDVIKTLERDFDAYSYTTNVVEVLQCLEAEIREILDCYRKGTFEPRKGTSVAQLRSD